MIGELFCLSIKSVGSFLSVGYRKLEIFKNLHKTLVNATNSRLSTSPALPDISGSSSK